MKVFRIFFSIFLLGATQLSALPVLDAPPPGAITGPNTVTVGVAETYKFTNGASVSSPVWVVTDEAQKLSTWVVGTDYFVSIRWNETGDFSIVFKSGTVTQATKYMSAYPGVPSGTGATRCGSGTVSLTASPGAGGNSIRWYDAPTGGNLLSTSTSFSPSVSGTTTYYITSYNTAWGYETSTTLGRVAVTAYVNPIPGQPGASGTSICGPGAVTLSASIGADGNTVRWYDASSGGNLLTSGTSYSTPTLYGTTTYYLSTYNSSTGCESTMATARVPVTVYVNPIPSAPGGFPNSRCGSGTVSLSASIGSNANTVRWYDASSGGSLLATSTTFTTPTISSSTTYYISSYNTGTGCESGRVAVTATVNPTPGAAFVEAISNQCGPGSVTIYASYGSNGNMVRFYDASSGGNLLATTLTYTTPALTSSTIYYMSSYNTSTGCESASRVAVTATINTIPGAPSASGSSRCGAGTVFLSATPGTNGSTVRWYSTSTGGSPLATSTTYTTPSLSSTTTYYLSTVSSAGCESTSARVPVTATIIPIPDAPIATSNARCGSGTVSLTASPGANGNTVYWYTTSTGGSAFHSGLAYSPNLSATTTYYLSSFNTAGCESTSARVPITATINPIPSSPIYNGGSRCGSGTITLSATSGSNGNTVRWYDASSGGTLLATGTTYVTPSLTSTTTFYITSYNSSTLCESTGTRTAAIATVNTIPGLPTPANNARCGSGTVQLTATTGVDGANVNWYTASSGGSSLATGTTFTTPSINSTTTYYISSTNFTCESARVAITAYVNAVPGIPSVNDETLCSGQVSLTATVGANGNTLKWSSSLGTFEGINYVIPNLASTTAFTVKSYNSSTGCESSSATKNVNVVTRPAQPYAVSTFVRGHGQVTLYADEGVEPTPFGYGFYWYNAATGGSPLASGMSYLTPDLTVPTDYYVAAYQPSMTSCESTRKKVTADIRPLISPGNAKTETVRVKGVVNDTQLAALTDAQKITTISHFDGLLRVNQQVAVKASPLGNDVVQPVEYDAQGRISKNYLTYVSSTTDGSFQANYKTQQPLFYNNSSDKVADDSAPFSTSVYEASPLGRLLEQGNIGSDFQPGTTHTQRLAYSYNAVNEVRRFNPDGSSSDFYPVNTILKVQSTDPDGNISIAYTNASGQTLLTKQQLNKVIDGVTVDYLETYYIYNDLGQVQYMISPKGVAALKSTWTFSQNIKDSYTYQFVYDSRGRIIEKKVPGQAWMYYVYDKLDRLVLAQDAMTRAQNKWLFVKYDKKGRVVMQGFYTNSVETTRAALQSIADALYTTTHPTYGENSWFESPMPGATGYSLNSFPRTNRDTNPVEVTSINYFDNHDFDFNGTNDFSYTPQSLPGENAPSRTYGLPTGGRRLILGTSNWLYTYAFYDEYGRVIQVRTNNHLNVGSIDNLTTNVYLFDGTLTTTKTYHNAGAFRITTVQNAFEYDTQGRLIKVKQRNDNGAEQVVAKYEYNELGQLVDKKLHNTTGENYLQSVDYRYTIRGQLKSINNSMLIADGSNDETNDYFGMELLYNDIAGGPGNSPLYNGNVSAMKWKGVGAAGGHVDQKSFKYVYDKSGKLESATYQVKGSGGWDKEVGALNESMTYDHNGNILTLQRNQRKHQLSGVIASYSSELIDNLTYGYNANNGNSLEKVTDASLTTGFNNGASGTNNDFTYDAHGNTTSDLNKGINTIAYNLLGKPTQISFSNGQVINYTYDGGGNKLAMSVTVSGVTTTTDYSGSFVYTNGTLSFFGSPEGRVVKNGSSLEYQYAISDNQGNTRVLFTSATSTLSAPIATFEGDSGDGASQYNHSASNVVTFLSANHTSSGSKVIRMNQTYKTGPSKSIKVYPGDKVDMEVWSYFEGSSGWGSTSTGVAAFVTNVAGAFGGVSGGSGESGAIYNGVNTAYGAAGMAGNQGDTRPSAYLNYILFDKDYKLLDMGWSVVPASANMAKQLVSIPTVNIKEPGYVFVYLSYEAESNNWVYFDDLKVTHTKTNIIQYNEYYPFGLSAATSWTRDGNKNDFLYNEGSELNVSTGWYDLPFRNYDPSLGRFMQIDPMSASEMATYQYGGDNPIMINDPSGATKNFKGLNSAIAKTDHDAFLSRAWASGSVSAFDLDWAFDGGGGGSGGYGPGMRSRADIEAAQAHYDDLNNQWVDAMAKYEDEEYVTSEEELEDFQIEIWDFFTNGIRDAQHYIDTEIKVKHKGVNQKIAVLDREGNLRQFDDGAFFIFVDMGNGEILPFRDQLAKTKKMTLQAFANGLANIVGGMVFQGFVGSKYNGAIFDRSLLFNGTFSINWVGLDGNREIYNFGMHDGSANTWRTPDGSLLITYTRLNGRVLTVPGVRGLLGVHEYFGHGINRLDNTDASHRIIIPWQNWYEKRYR
ncbi:MAG TPA: DUF6443 domain-containing protein [Chryseosolibacter sp.]